MDDFGGNENYGLKVLLGCIIGIIIVLFLIPLGANIIATEQVNSAANNALSTPDTSIDSSSLNIPVDTSKFDTNSVPVTNNSTNKSNSTNKTNNQNIPNNNNSNNQINQPTDLSNMRILSGSISTGSGLNDKSVCTIYVGKEYAGQTIQMSTLYSRDGTDLNAGRLVTKTVDSTGYVTLPAAESYKLYPSHCLISIYDTNGNELDYKSVDLAIESGTQYF